MDCALLFQGMVLSEISGHSPWSCSHMWHSVWSNTIHLASNHGPGFADVSFPIPVFLAARMVLDLSHACSLVWCFSSSKLPFGVVFQYLDCSTRPEFTLYCTLIFSACWGALLLLSHGSECCFLSDKNGIRLLNHRPRVWARFWTRVRRKCLGGSSQEGTLSGWRLWQAHQGRCSHSLHYAMHAPCFAGSSFNSEVCTFCRKWFKHLLSVLFDRHQELSERKSLQHRFELARKSVPYHKTLPF